MMQNHSISPEYAARLWFTMKLNYSGVMMNYAGVKRGFSCTENQFRVFEAIAGKYNTVARTTCLYAANLVVEQTIAPYSLLSGESELRYIEFRKYILNPISETRNHLQKLLSKYTIKDVFGKMPTLLVSGELSPELAVTLNRCYSVFEHHSSRNDYIWGILQNRMLAHMKYCSLKDENLIPVLIEEIENLIGEMKNAITC